MSSSGLARVQLVATSRIVEQFTEAILSPDEAAPGAYVRELLRQGVSPATLIEEVFTPAARVLGERWKTDECSFYEVTLASGHIQRLLRAVSPLFLADSAPLGSTGRMLLTGASGEQHSLGSLVIAEYFIRDGWDVHLLTTYSPDILLDMVRKTAYHCVGFSVACTQHLPGLRKDIRRVRQVSRNNDIRVLVGGQLLDSEPSLAEDLGVDAVATDAESAVLMARRLRGIAELTLG
ncbi:MAG: B12-binding domain-containing protein [Gemmatimonadota bacterium]